MFRVGVIGLGFISDTHIQGFSSIQDVEITAVADINEDCLDECAEKFTVQQQFRDYRELLQLRDLDLVVVCLPNHLHAEATIAALDLGHNVLCEKPMATTLADAGAMVAAASANDRTLSIVMNFRWQFFGPDAFHLKKLIEDGELGDIYYVRAHYLRRSTFPSTGFDRWNLSQEKSGGGVLIDLGPHMLDLVMWLLDDYSPQSVNGMTHTGLIEHSTVDDFASGTVKMKGDTHVHLDLAWNSHNESLWRIHVYGEKGGALIDANQPPGERIRRFSANANGPASMRVAPGDIEWPPDATLQEHIVRRTVAGKAPDCSADNALQVMKVIEAWYQSGASGREIIF